MKGALNAYCVLRFCVKHISQVNIDILIGLLLVDRASKFTPPAKFSPFGFLSSMNILFENLRLY